MVGNIFGKISGFIRINSAAAEIKESALLMSWRAVANSFKSIEICCGSKVTACVGAAMRWIVRRKHAVGSMSLSSLASEGPLFLGLAMRNGLSGLPTD